MAALRGSPVTPATSLPAPGPQVENSELLVGNTGTRRTGQRQDLNILEARFSAPLGEITAGEVEGVAELDQHVERHHQSKRVFAASVVDQVLDDDERASFGKGLVS